MGRATWHQGISCPEKMVLVAIADVSDDNGLAYMLLQTLMQKTSLSRRGAQTAIAGLIEKRILLRKERKHRSSIFKIVVESLPMGRPPVPERELSDDHFWDNIEGAGDAPSYSGKGAGDAPPRARGAPQGAGDAHILPVKTPVSTPDSPLFLTEELPPRDLLGDILVERPATADLIEYVTAEWAKLCEEYPRIQNPRVLNDARKKKIRARANEVAKPSGGRLTPHDVWDQVFAAIRASAFLRGEAEPGRNYRDPFSLSIDKICEPARFLQTLERYSIDVERNQHTHSADGRRYGPAEQAMREVIASMGLDRK